MFHEFLHGRQRLKGRRRYARGYSGGRDFAAFRGSRLFVIVVPAILGSTSGAHLRRRSWNLPVVISA